ncbi:hypothetical protein B0H12DRAFT_815335 [Mycena haematopus]|nr:hypothetical protein B0H12DRAFT_815335 [Mycena haematopus]
MEEIGFPRSCCMRTIGMSNSTTRCSGSSERAESSTKHGQSRLFARSARRGRARPTLAARALVSSVAPHPPAQLHAIARTARSTFPFRTALRHLPRSYALRALDDCRLRFRGGFRAQFPPGWVLPRADQAPRPLHGNCTLASPCPSPHGRLLGPPSLLQPPLPPASAPPRTLTRAGKLRTVRGVDGSRSSPPPKAVRGHKKRTARPMRDRSWSWIHSTGPVSMCPRHDGQRRILCPNYCAQRRASRQLRNSSAFTEMGRRRHEGALPLFEYARMRRSPVPTTTPALPPLPFLLLCFLGPPSHTPTPRGTVPSSPYATYTHHGYLTITYNTSHL